MINYLIALIITINLLCLAYMGYRYFQQKSEALSFVSFLQLSFSGFFAAIADVTGLGSFAANISFAQIFNTFKDEQLPLVVNAAQVLPGAVIALCFILWFDVDLNTLLTFAAGVSLGGGIGALWGSRLRAQSIRLIMMLGILIIIAIYIAHCSMILPFNGDLTALHSSKLVIGFFAAIFCGFWASFGIGLFVSIQAVFFFLDVTPLMAFPVMAVAGSLQQPISTFILSARSKTKVPFKEIFILSLSGCVALVLVLPLFSRLMVNWLHWLLFLILFYNLISIGQNYFHIKTPGYWQKLLGKLYILKRTGY